MILLVAQFVFRNLLTFYLFIFFNCLSINNPPVAVLVSKPRALLSMSDCMSVLVSARQGRLTISTTTTSATGNTAAKGRKKSNYFIGAGHVLSLRPKYTFNSTLL